MLPPAWARSHSTGPTQTVSTGGSYAELVGYRIAGMDRVVAPEDVVRFDSPIPGVLDVGGLGPADPALDLVSAWHLLEAGPRRLLRDDLGCDDLEWRRGRLAV